MTAKTLSLLIEASQFGKPGTRKPEQPGKTGDRKTGDRKPGTGGTYSSAARKIQSRSFAVLRMTAPWKKRRENSGKATCRSLRRRTGVRRSQETPLTEGTFASPPR